MEHKFIRIKTLKKLKGYEIEVHFDDGAVRRIDFEPVLIGPFWGELKDRDLFDRFSLDEEVGTITWPNGADFDPDTLYRWDEIVPRLEKQLRSA